MDTKNKLYFGDNLKILREYVGDASVDLIYLDPPFNSSPSAFARGGEPFSFAQGRELVERRESNRATYNVLFKGKSGEESAATSIARGSPILFQGWLVWARLVYFQV
jgi:DNA modification methylase